DDTPAAPALTLERVTQLRGVRSGLPPAPELQHRFAAFALPYRYLHEPGGQSRGIIVIRLEKGYTPGYARILSNVSKDPVELVQAVVAHHELPFAALRVLDQHLRPELIGEVLLQPADIRIGGAGALARRGALG